MSTTGTNVVRIAVAALLGLAACLVAWWPQSAAGSGDTAAVSSVAAAVPTQNTPTPTRTPTATVAPTTAAPPPAPPPSTPKPTKKPTKKPNQNGGGNGGNGGGNNPPTLHNNGGSNGGNNNNGGSSNNNNNPPNSSSGSTSAPYVPPPAAPSAPVAPPTKQSAPAATPTAAPTTEVPTPAAQVTEDDQAEGTDDAETYDTYLTSSEPVQTTSAPVWVVPGILLVLTSMLALLGGVLGRGARPAVAVVKNSDEGDEHTQS